jgi:hypothetical protein
MEATMTIQEKGGSLESFGTRGENWDLSLAVI